MRTETFGRVDAHNPGKHGPRDWRVEFNGAAPTHGEMVFMLGMVLLAEQRYNGRDALGSGMIMHFLGEAAKKDNPEDIRRQAQWAENT